MQVGQQTQCTASTGGLSEKNTTSEDGLILEALRKMMRKELEVMVIRTVHQVIEPMMEGLVRRVVKKEIQSAQEKHLASGKQSADQRNISRERTLQLNFLDEVSVPVLTGKAIEGKGSTPMRVALVDKTTGQIVDRGPEASAKVEILVLEASHDDNDENWSTKDFNNKIIRESDKTKPHFAKSKCINLGSGIGVLSNVRLGHGSSWMKPCQCRLGARLIENFNGINVEEAWTKPFLVSDSRSKLYKKNYPPSLSDEVWRLDNIGRDGDPCKRLNKKDIWTVQDFLFQHSIDPLGLQKIVGARDKMWKVTMGHARTCRIDDEQIYLYKSHSSKFQMNVTFDVIGKLRGIIRDSHYVPVESLSEADKARANELLRLAFENRKEIISFKDEVSLLQEFPCESTVDDHPLEIISEYIPQEPAPDHGRSCPLPEPGFDPGPSSPLHYLNSFCENFGDNQSLMSLLCGSYPEILRPESHSRNRSIAGIIRLVGTAAVVFCWLARARKRCAKKKRAMDSGDVNVQKKQRFSEEECP